MRVVPVSPLIERHAGRRLHLAALPSILAALALTAGCAMNNPAPGIGHAAPGCHMNAVLYCELAPHGEKCQCIRHADFRDMMRTVSSH